MDRVVQQLRAIEREAAHRNGLRAPVFIQRFIKTLDHPLLRKVYVRDLVGVAMMRKRVVQVVPVRIAQEDEEAFETELRAGLEAECEEVWTEVYEFPDVNYYVIATGPDMRPAFDRVRYSVEKLRETS